MKQLLILFISATIFCSACTMPPSKSELKSDSGSDSYLGHIDVILDSVTWFAIKSDSFLKNEFSAVELDTVHYGGKPSYDIYLLGNNNFMHLSLAKGYWDDQQKGGVIVFQKAKSWSGFSTIEPMEKIL